MKHTTRPPAVDCEELVARTLRLSDRWIVHWLNRPPSIAKYQTPVNLERDTAKRLRLTSHRPESTPVSAHDCKYIQRQLACVNWVHGFAPRLNRSPANCLPDRPRTICSREFRLC